MVAGAQYKLKSPMYLKGVHGNGKNRNKKYAINRNHIHESNRFSLAKAKQIYKKLMAPQIAQLPLLTKIKVLYVVHRGDKRSGDRNNVASETDKFFMDALVKQGKLPDDSDNHYEYTVFRSGKITKGDPHVSITIEELA